MTVIATRKREKNITYTLVRNIILACFAFAMSCLLFFYSDPSIVAVAIAGSLCALLGIVVVLLGIKDFKFNKRVNRLPETALCKHYNKLIVCNQEETIINIKDIKEIKSRRYIKTSFGFAQYVSKEGILKIKTNERVYKLENVEDVKEIHKQLNSWTEKFSK